MAEPVPAVMRAAVLTGYGGYERLDLRRDVPVPQPGAGEVLVRVGAAGVNNTDINTRIGWYGKDVAAATDALNGQGSPDSDASGWSGEAFVFPRIQGADCCGKIVMVGDGVAASRLGERVLIDPILRDAGGKVRYFGSECDGGFADYARVPARNAHPVASQLTDAELASFPCAYSTAENILTRMALGRDETVLVTGASGGVGSAAVQLAMRRGARVIAVAGEDKAADLLRLGAAQVVPRTADLVAAIGENAVDAVVDIVGGPGFAGLLACLRPGGRYGTSGAIAGPVVELDLRTLYLKDLRLFGCTVLEPEVFPNLVGYIERGEIRPLVAATFPLEQIVAAQQTFLEKRHVGKIVLTL